MKIKVLFAALAAALLLSACGNSPKYEARGRLLVITDVQRDFYDPSGALYVEGSEELPKDIMRIAGLYDGVIVTMDWHPGNHCSFHSRMGLWPKHCVQYTQGAGLPDEFYEMLRQGDKYHARIFLKGVESEKEEYGAFADLSDYPEIKYWLENCASVDICGIAGDFCVLETAKNILKYVPAEKLTVLKRYIRSIDNGEKLDKFISDNGLKSVE